METKIEKVQITAWDKWHWNSKNPSLYNEDYFEYSDVNGVTITHGYREVEYVGNNTWHTIRWLPISEALRIIETGERK